MQAANRATLTRLYSAFAHLDPDTMAGCYAPDVRFSDEVFSLDGHEQVMGMWCMLCESLEAAGRADWKLNYRIESVGEREATAHWNARYRFGRAGRVVHNRIEARFRFDDHGLIQVHHDAFDFWRWSRQALGVSGVLLGWTPLLRWRVRKGANARLRQYLASLAARPHTQP